MGNSNSSNCKSTMKLVVLLALVACAFAERKFIGDQVIRCFPTEEQKGLFDAFQAKYDVEFWAGPEGPRPVDMHVRGIFTNIVKAALTENNVKYEIMIHDLQADVDAQTDRARLPQMSLDSFDYNVYHTLDEIESWMEDMVAKYSDASFVNAGTSYEKRNIRAIKISSGKSNAPAYVINCGLHAREWVNPASCLYAVKYLLESSASENFRSEIDYYITPISNPDGYVYTWTGDRMWRKTRSLNNLFCDGVDPNRNFDINWSGPGASSSSCNDAFYGPSVMSEIEVQSLANHVASIPNVKGFIDIHAYSQYWMFAYAYTYRHTRDHDILTVIGDESAAAIKASHGKTYAAGAISEVIYQASGSTTDYVYEKLGVKCSFASELRDTGRYGFVLPENQIQPTAEESFAGLMVIAKYVANGTC